MDIGSTWGEERTQKKCRKGENMKGTRKNSKNNLEEAHGSKRTRDKGTRLTNKKIKDENHMVKNTNPGGRGGGEE